MTVINLIANDNGVGITRDTRLMADALRANGVDVVMSFISPFDRRKRRSKFVQAGVLARMWYEKKIARRARPRKFDANLMFEHVWPAHLELARINIGLPNPEWFDRNDQRFLHALDWVWAKTHYTQEIFLRLGKQTFLTGFDSEDRFDPSVPRERSFFHLAGKSPLKGTARLLELWLRHPEWPMLTVVQSRNLDDVGPTAKNVRVRTEYLSDTDLKTLQNRHIFHLCPSEAEGWGHYIVEALSIGAIVITNDAAPMNELVTTERGILVPCSPAGCQRLATLHQFDIGKMEQAVTHALSLTQEQCRAIAEASQIWVRSNRQGFAKRVGDALAALR